MSKRIEMVDDKTGVKIVVPVIEVEPDDICAECGKLDELRPYGHKGACICHNCAMKDPARTEHNLKIQLFGDKGELL